MSMFLSESQRYYYKIIINRRCKKILKAIMHYSVLISKIKQESELTARSNTSLGAEFQNMQLKKGYIHLFSWQVVENSGSNVLSSAYVFNN